MQFFFLLDHLDHSFSNLFYHQSAFSAAFSHIWEKCFWHLLSVICIWKKRIGARGRDRVEVTDLKDVTGCLIGHSLSECPVWNVWLKITTHHTDTRTRLEQFIFLTISQFQCNSQLFLMKLMYCFQNPCVFIFWLAGF